jgi:iron complex outermembrane receptor protein
MKPNVVTWRALLLATAAVLCSAGAAVAQDAAGDQTKPVEGIKKNDATTTETTGPSPAAGSAESIVVTGSRLRSNQGSSPVEVIGAEQASEAGLMSAADILQTTTIAEGSLQFNNRFGGFVLNGGTGVRTIALHGLGGQQALVLLNGERPGPSGTRGQVGGFDLSVIPDAIVNRYELLKDSASSVYGSDAIAGVINIITRDSVDRPEITGSVSSPLAGGGEVYTLSGAYGLNYNHAKIVFAGELQEDRPIRLEDRDFLSCSHDLVKNPANGQYIDRLDHSIYGGTKYNQCSNVGIINAVDDLLTGGRYVPSPTGQTQGPFPGYVLNHPTTYANSPAASYTADIFSPLFSTGDVQAENKLASFYSKATVDLPANIAWQTEFLYTRRQTVNNSWRQFFPIVTGATIAPYSGDPTYDNPLQSEVRPIMPYPSNQNISIDYYTLTSKLDGGFGGFLSSWNWNVSSNFTLSDGRYKGNVIDVNKSGDANLYAFDQNTGFVIGAPPPVDYFSPGILSGTAVDKLVAAVGGTDIGHTIYDQFDVNASVTGSLFRLPAGDVQTALGVEYRYYSIDDRPGPFSQNGTSWGLTSAGVTKGSDEDKEVFGEIKIPILAKLPFIEDLSVNGSGRAFDYKTVGSDTVWKAGVNWQVTPSFRIRATHGTSFRAPALFELYLANQTSFVSQANDPCIEWDTSSNPNIVAHCQAAGIPPGYLGNQGASAEDIAGGGAGLLKPETSTATTAGFVVTPTGFPLNFEVTYWKIEVDNEIQQLGAANILFACYGLPVFPNQYCNLFTRGQAGAPFAINQIQDGYINLNSDIREGIDFNVHYQQDFNFGTVLFDVDATKETMKLTNVFDPTQVSGFASNNFNGDIGDPKFVANTHLAFKKGNWTLSWFANYIGNMDDTIIGLQQTATYQGFHGAYFDYKTQGIWYHDLSVEYSGNNYKVILGLDNVFDKEPPKVSTGETRYGVIPAFASQYRLDGQTIFATVQKKF